jgi:hypothetical protein
VFPVRPWTQSTRTDGTNFEEFEYVNRCAILAVFFVPLCP